DDNVHGEIDGSVLEFAHHPMNPVGVRLISMARAEDVVERVDHEYVDIMALLEHTRSFDDGLHGVLLREDKVKVVAHPPSRRLHFRERDAVPLPDAKRLAGVLADEQCRMPLGWDHFR